MQRKALRVERAAGGVVVRNGSTGREVLLIDDAYGHVAFPKGHLEPGESWEAAAIREVAEETGIEARILAPLGRVAYTIQRDGTAVEKQVRLFLMEAIDEEDSPRPQVEELANAYFLPWSEAVWKQQTNGYRNWDWLLPKADALLAWHDGHYAARWRDLNADAASAELLVQWRSAQPVYAQLLKAVVQELQTVAPETLPRGFDGEFTIDLPRTISDEHQALCAAIEHTLLKPSASVVDIENLCREALTHRFAAVCVNPQHVGRCNQLLAGSPVIRCAVVGFPLGAADVTALTAETEAVIRAGATEVDMVIPVGSMAEDDIWTVYQHVDAVVQAARAAGGDSVKVKAILETHYLEPDQIAKAALAAVAAGASFVKTSTGFAPTGARIADVALLAAAVQGRAGVKASGGIKSRLQALNFLRYGADRLGTSSGLAMVRE